MNSLSKETEIWNMQSRITILERVSVVPIYFQYSRMHALCLEGMGRWHVDWKNDLTQALQYMEQASGILTYYNSFQNLSVELASMHRAAIQNDLFRLKEELIERTDII